ncbi:hypothetical protein V6N13_098954 [Hibiscus sabdariffa]|uniref:Uncharacterized protein n=1 Tax=Hibiscus sabdariffa TaxID=183260 RepID=A0ABR2P941_9ROSI
MQCLDKLIQLNSDSKHQFDAQDLVQVTVLLNDLSELCCANKEDSGNAAIVAKNGGIELVCSIYYVQSSETFRSSGGQKIVVGILRDGTQDLDSLNSNFAVVAAASTVNEVVKQSFMELGIDELILQVLSGQTQGSVESLYDVIRVLLTSHDNRVVASEVRKTHVINLLGGTLVVPQNGCDVFAWLLHVYGYARRALVESLQGRLSLPSLVSASIALKAVDDEIRKSIADAGGIDTLLKCVDESGEQHNKSVART